MEHEEKENSLSLSDYQKEILWNPNLEKICIEWHDTALCYHKLHSDAYKRQIFLLKWFDTPIQVLSILSGAGSFSQSSIPKSFQPYSPLLIGAINIFVSILTGIRSQYKIAEKCEIYKSSERDWFKLNHVIKIELMKKPIDRVPANVFIKIIHHEYDRLMDTTAFLPDIIIKKFNIDIKGEVGTEKRKLYDSLNKPGIIINGITSIKDIRGDWDPFQQNISKSISNINLANTSYKNSNIPCNEENIEEHKEIPLSDSSNKYIKEISTIRK